MATASLTAAPRSQSGKGVARSLRREGRTPGVVYGRTREALPLSLDSRELERLLGHINAETTVIDLNVDGTASRTLIREIQRHPIQRNVIHVDFYEIVAGEKVTVRIPIVLQGTPAGVRLFGGIVNQVLQELECSVDPSNIPNRIEVDVTEIAIGHSVHVSDITIPEGVEVLNDGGETVMIVAAPKEEVAATPAAEEAEAAPSEPELIRKPKPEEEEGEK